MATPADSSAFAPFSKEKEVFPVRHSASTPHRLTLSARDLPPFDQHSVGAGHSPWPTRAKDSEKLVDSLLFVIGGL